MATARIKYLTLETIIGANERERNVKQKVVINVEYEFSAAKAVDTVLYDPTTGEITVSLAAGFAAGDLITVNAVVIDQ